VRIALRADLIGWGRRQLQFVVAEIVMVKDVAMLGHLQCPRDGLT
jgi:hypothetical protein